MRGICIYCNSEGEMSREHILPACLGEFKNSELLIGKVCKNCNSKLSVLDEQFCRCGPEGFYRIMLGITGRKYHRKPSPFYRGSAGGKRIEMKTRHPTKDVDIYVQLNPKSNATIPVRQIIVKGKEGTYHSILIDDHMKQPDDLERELNNRGLAESELVEAWGDEEDSDLMKILCSIFKETLKWTDKFPYEDSEKQIHTVTLVANDRYFRAICKITFHYLLKNFSQFTGFEEEFRDIKDFILKGGDTDKWVRQVRGFFVEDLKHGLTTGNYCHLINIEKIRFHIESRLQFFIGPRGQRYHYKVFIGRNPETIFYPQSIGHQFVYFEKPDKEGFIGRVDPLIAVSRRLAP